MPLTERETVVMNEIRSWEKNLLNYEANDFQLLYEKYLERSFSLLPEKVQRQFFYLIDGWLFHLYSIIQGSQLQMDAKERILTSGRIFRKDIEKIADLRQLDIDQLQYIAEQQISKHRLYSFAQGGLSGTGGTLLLGADIPAMAVINLRVVQLIAMTYGFEVNTPFEMMTSLKVFHTATLPPRIQKEGWASLMIELEAHEELYFYEGNEKITDITWLEQPVQQLFKAMVIMLFRKRAIQGIPLVSMAIGAGTNYQLTRKVTDFAHKYYQLRYLKEKEESYDE
ncbi:EcsC family protein [Neobacillus bataviensis]|uniref:EcsC family protein n=1 Tax=Neobacillus bataviensis TaxID=220685 RepID=A0A561DH24_9BACI|nr:EcsC family protein [Neobacillus bataviensis]TWE02667.1 EcsC family protein [Neobacillus bataviensis]